MKNKGFTLIELLVVIAIIGLLSSVVLASLNTARTKSRDARRKSDIKQLELALEFHYDEFGSYTQPENMNSDCSTGSSCSSSGSDWAASSDLRDLVTNGFIPSLPIDPTNNASYRYTYEPWNAGQGGYSAGGQAYDLCANLEEGGTFCINKRN